MFYYAEINSEYQVINKYCLSEESTNPNYILITEDLYTNGNELGDIVGQFYNTLSGVIEIVDPGWDMGQTCWMRYKDGKMRLSTKLDNMDKATSLKANIDHTHEGYASSDDLQELEDVVSTKANAVHTHTEYAPVTHSHSEYAPQTSLDSAIETLESEIEGKADASHTHSEYASSTHLHNEYSNVNHNHNTNYAPLSHSHTEYVTTVDFNALETEVDGKANENHIHDNYATVSDLNELSSVVSSKANAADLNSHVNDTDIHISESEREYWNAKSDFSGSYNDLSNKPTIPSISGLATETYVDEAVSTKADSNHNHNSIYYTETEIDNLLSGKANASHSHNDIYYTETEINDKLATKADSSHNHTGVYDVSGAAASALSSAQTYTDEAIDALSETVATKADASTLSSHTGNTAVHITSAERSKLSGIAEGANNYVLPSAGTSLGGVKSGGDVTISSGVITVNDDSHNHVISNVDGLQSALDSKAASGHNHDGVYYTETEIDTLLEGKANSSHTHTISNITNLQSTLDGKANASHGTHVSYSTTAPVMDGSASVGTASTVARSDHKHPTDTSRAAQTSLDSHTSNKSNPHGVTLAQLGLTATAAELNALDGITATVTELNFVDGVTSNIQTQLNSKAASSHTHTIANITNLQSTLDGKAASSHTHKVANISDLTATATELNYMDGVTSNVQTQLDGKAASGHTHSYAGSSSVGGSANSANKLATARTISLTGDVSGSTSFDGSGNVSITATVVDDSHNHIISNIDGLQSALDAKATSNHKHYAKEITVAGEDLNNYTEAGIYTFAQAYAPTNVPAGTNGWLVVIPWGEGGTTIKQLWFRHGTSGTNDHETYVRTKISNVDTWSSWSKYYTTSNPPTYAEVGASPAFTNTNGGVKYSYNTSAGKDLIDEIDAMPQGVHTIYSQGGVSGNPKTTESWRLLVHKTSATIGWIVAFGSSGSIYANYQNAASSFTGWKCVYEATNKMILWTGASYLTSTNSVPQVVTPSKKLSECRTGWLLLWSDYDASTSTANDNDFCTTFIPKYTPAGGTWGGKAFLCSLPTYVGGDASDLSTQITVIKPIYVHDDCLKGSYQNTTGGRNDVVLRAVYEV